MKRLLRALLWAVAGYVAGIFAGVVLVQALSPNTHDLAAETAMTAAFVTGPLGAGLAFVAGLLTAPRRST